MPPSFLKIFQSTSRASKNYLPVQQVILVLLVGGSTTILLTVEFVVFTELTMKSMVLWVVTTFRNGLTFRMNTSPPVS
jgi:hypothetical protein